MLCCASEIVLNHTEYGKVKGQIALANIHPSILISFKVLSF